MLVWTLGIAVGMVLGVLAALGEARRLPHWVTAVSAAVFAAVMVWGLTQAQGAVTAFTAGVALGAVVAYLVVWVAGLLRRRQQPKPKAVAAPPGNPGL